MKNKMVVVIVGLLMINLVPAAKAENTLSAFKEYGIPCALSIALSAALVKTDGAKIGVAVCAGISAATFLNKKTLDEDQLKLVVEQAVEDKEMKITSETDSKLQKAADSQSAKMEDFRKMVREVLADRLVKMEEDMRSSVQKQMNSADFMPSLEQRLNAKMKEEVIIEGKARSRELVNQVVDEVIRQVEAKPIAYPSKDAQ